MIDGLQLLSESTIQSEVLRVFSTLSRGLLGQHSRVEAINETLIFSSCFEAQTTRAIVNTQKRQHTQNPLAIPELFKTNSEFFM